MDIHVGWARWWGKVDCHGSLIIFVMVPLGSFFGQTHASFYSVVHIAPTHPHTTVTQTAWKAKKKRTGLND